MSKTNFYNNIRLAKEYYDNYCPETVRSDLAIAYC